MLFGITGGLFSHKQHTTYGKFLPYQKIGFVQLEKMYEVYKLYYQNTNFLLFKEDFKKKDGAILIFDSKTNLVVGFSTVVINHMKYEGKNYRFIFSGDTVIEKKYWGSRALQNTMFKLIVKTRLKYPFDQVFWMLISKGWQSKT